MTASLVLFGILSTLITLFFLPQVVAGESSLLKAATVAFTVFMWLGLFAFGQNLRGSFPSSWNWGVLLASLALMASAILPLVGLDLFESNAIHTSENIQQRSRGTRFEASSLGAGLLIVPALLLVNRHGRWPMVAYGLLSIGVLVTSQSRGGVLVALAVFPVCLVLLCVGGKWLRLVPRFGHFIFAAAMLGISFYLDRLLGSDSWRSLGLAADASDATRGTWARASLSSAVQYPLGTGYAGFVEWVPQILREAGSVGYSSFGFSQMREIGGIMTGVSDLNFSPKTLPQVAALYWGWAGIFWIGWLYYRTSVSSFSGCEQGRVVNIPIMLALVLTSCAFLGSFASWDMALLLGLLLSAPQAAEEVPSGSPNEGMTTEG